MAQFIRQGDLLFRPVKSVPRKAKKVFTGKSYVVAEGEHTGHKHVVTIEKPDTDFSVYEFESQAYLKFGSEATLTHNEHNTQVLAPTTYVVVQEQEFDYFAKEVVRVQD